jgi:hypothetical protein
MNSLPAAVGHSVRKPFRKPYQYWDYNPGCFCKSCQRYRKYRGWKRKRLR